MGAGAGIFASCLFGGLSCILLMGLMRKQHSRGFFILGLMALSAVGLAGCRGADRTAWAAEARAIASWSWKGFNTPPSVELLQRQKSLSEYISGVLAETQGELAEAKGRYARAYQYDPDSVQVLLRLGTAQLQLNELEEAGRSLEKAILVDSADSRPKFLLGVLYTHQQRFEEASHQYAEVLSLDPRNLGALSQLADLYMLQDKVQDGLKVYERLLQERPDSPVAHFNAGVLCLKAQQWEQAVKHMAEAAKLDPSYLEARMGWGVTLELTGKLHEAKEQFLKALELQPMNTQLIHYMARVCIQLGELEEGAQWLVQYLSFYPRDWRVYVELGYLRMDQGRWEESVKVFESAFDRFRKDIPPVAQDTSVEDENAPAMLWTALGLAYESGRQFPQAEQAYREAVAVAATDPKPYLYLGALYHRLEAYEKAEAVFSAGHQLHPDNPDVLNGLGYLYADWGRQLDQAAGLIQRALAQDPKNGSYLDSLGWAYYRMGKLEESRTVLEEAIQQTPDTEIFEHLGQVYFSLGRSKEAEASWKKGLDLGSSRPELIQRLKSNIKRLKRKDR